MSFSEDASNLAADLADAKALLGRAKRPETKSRLVAYVRAATAREVEVLAAQNTPKAEPSKEREPQDDAPKAEAAGYVEREPSPADAASLHKLATEVGVKAPPKRLPPSKKGVVVSAPVEARTAPPAAPPRFDRSGAEAPPPLGAGADVPDRVASIWETAKRDKLADEMEAAAAADRAAAEAPAPAPPRKKADPPRSRAFDGCKKGFLGGAAPAKTVTAPPPPPETKKKSSSLSDFARKLPPAKDPQMHHRRAAAYERHREREAAEREREAATANAGRAPAKREAVEGRPRASGGGRGRAGEGRRGRRRRRGGADNRRSHRPRPGTIRRSTRSPPSCGPWATAKGQRRFRTALHLNRSRSRRRPRRGPSKHGRQLLPKRPSSPSRSSAGSRAIERAPGRASPCPSKV